MGDPQQAPKGPEKQVVVDTPLAACLRKVLIEKPLRVADLQRQVAARSGQQVVQDCGDDLRADTAAVQSARAKGVAAALWGPQPASDEEVLQAFGLTLRHFRSSRAAAEAIRKRVRDFDGARLCFVSP